MNNIAKVIWFSRHALTEEQRKDIISSHPGAEIISCAAAASVSVNTVEEAAGQFAELVKMGADAIYGVFSAAHQAVLFSNAEWAVELAVAGDFYQRHAIPCFAGINSQRSAEGGTPTFSHLKFVKVGVLIRA